MLKRLRNIVRENRDRHDQNAKSLKEILWGHKYRDSINDKEWLKNKSYYFNVYAANYCFFYLLNRVLFETKPKSILEIGLGETSKLVSHYLDNLLFNSTCDIIDTNFDWINYFNSNFSLNERIKIYHSELNDIEVRNRRVEVLTNISSLKNKSYDLYLVDGPIGCEGFSRYDIVLLAEDFLPNKEFIIIFDDYNRPGEQRTIECLFEVFKNKNIKYYTSTYEGLKTVLLILSERYKHLQYC